MGSLMKSIIKTKTNGSEKQFIQKNPGYKLDIFPYTVVNIMTKTEFCVNTEDQPF